MSAHTKIVVLRSKELLYTILLLFVGILIILVLLSLFLPSDSDSVSQDSAALYVPGVYSLCSETPIISSISASISLISI